jgi:hypothetical protein
MTRFAIDSRALAALLALGAPLLGCGGSEGGDDPTGTAVLSIEGSSAVTVSPGGVAELAVRYLDDADEPLAGKVVFEVIGYAAGASLSLASADADADGRAAIQLRTEAAASFQVQASAPDTAPVSWTITVSQSGGLSLAGTYTVTSRIPIVSDVSGALGDVGGIIVELTDDPNDPATFLLDQLSAALDNDLFSTLIGSLRPGLDAALNGIILDAAPDLLEQIRGLSALLDEASRNLGLTSTIVVTGDGGEYTATHSVTGFGFEIAGQMFNLDLASLGLEDIEIPGITIQLEGDKITISRQTIPVRYGALLSAALEQIVLPLLGTDAETVRDLLAGSVDCASIAEELAEQIGIGGPAMYEGACDLAVDAAAEFLDEGLAGLDTEMPLNLVLIGTADVVDGDDDGAVDGLVAGKWAGDVDLGGTMAQLPEGAIFTAERQ